VCVWPDAAARRHQPPLVLRLIQVQNEHGTMSLVTSVLSARDLLFKGMPNASVAITHVDGVGVPSNDQLSGRRGCPEKRQPRSTRAALSLSCSSDAADAITSASNQRCDCRHFGVFDWRLPADSWRGIGRCCAAFPTG